MLFFGMTLITALCYLPPLLELCLGQPTPGPWTPTLICPTAFPDLRSPSLRQGKGPGISSVPPRAPGFSSLEFPPFFAYLNWGAGLLAGLSSTLSPHPITVPPSGGWAEGLHSKLPALALGSQPREDVLPLLSPLATALCTGAVAAAAAAPW